MAKFLGPIPQFQAINASGVPLASGKVYTYVSGSSVPAPTYTDRGGLTANPNPVVLDSQGRANIWLSEGLSYRFVVKNALDVTQYTVDDVEGINDVSGVLLDLSSQNAPTGASLVGFKQPDSGATGRTLQNKLQEVLSITDFGAVGDGTTNDTPAIQAALNAAAGRSLYIPAASVFYEINDTLSVPADTRVFGDGFDSKIVQITREKNVFTLAGDNCTIENVHIQGDNQTTGVSLTKNNGVYASSVKKARVLNCFIEKCENGGVHFENVLDADVRGNVIFQCPVGTSTSGADIVFYSNTAGGRSVIAGNHCYSNNTSGIFVNALGGDADIVIADNVCVTLDANFAEVASGGVRRHGVSCAYNGGGGRLSIIGNICRNTRWSGIMSEVAAGPNGPAAIVGNVCSNNGYDTTNSLSGGIFIQAVTGGCVVSGNVVADFRNTSAATGGITINGGDTDGHVLVHGNGVYGSLGSGIALVNSIRHVRVEANYIWASAGTDVYCSASSGDATLGDVVISNNTIRRNSGTTNNRAIILDSAAGANRWTIRGNRIYGNDSTTAAGTNCGIAVRFPQYCDVIDNEVDNFYYGIGVFDGSGNVGAVAGATRFFSEFRWDRNRLRNCNTGIVMPCNANTSCVPLEGNVFESTVTNKVAGAGGFVAGYIARRDGTKFVIQQGTAAPATGTWLAGDRIDFDAPAAGAAPGAVCTTGGNPGTWKTYATLAP